MRIDPSNAATAAGWDGPTGDFWVDHADLFDAGVGRYLPSFLNATAIEPGSRVLDVGCGTGQTTREAARLASDGTAVGIDLSVRMLDLARQRAERAGLTNMRFDHADAQVADLAQYDRIVSRTGAMFFGDPVAAFTNLHRALAPGGRLVLAVWLPYGEQEWIGSFRRAVDAAPLDGVGPFSLGDPDRVRGVLTAAGFDAPEFTPVREPMFYGPDVATAEEMALGIVGGLLADHPDRAAAEARLRADLQEHLGPDGVTYRSGMWMITAERAG